MQRFVKIALRWTCALSFVIIALPVFILAWACEGDDDVTLFEYIKRAMS